MTPVQPSTLVVSPGPSRTKLNDEALRLLGQEPEQYERVHSQSAKRYFPVEGVITSCPGQGQAEQIPSSVGVDATEWSKCLRQIFILEDADTTEVVPVRGVEAVIGLIANVYFVQQLAPEYSTVLMQRAAELLQRGVQVKVLRRKRHPERIAEAAESIEREIFKDALPVLQ
jgi:hypothetical protein